MEDLIAKLFSVAFDLTLDHPGLLESVAQFNTFDFFCESLFLLLLLASLGLHHVFLLLLPGLFLEFKVVNNFYLLLSFDLLLKLLFVFDLTLPLQVCGDVVGHSRDFRVDGGDCLISS
jgi:hypothetical protein